MGEACGKARSKEKENLKKRLKGYTGAIARYDNDSIFFISTRGFDIHT